MKKNIKRSTAKKQNGVNAQASERKHDCKAQVQRLLLMLKRKVNVEESGYYIGIDLGDRKSNYCFMDAGKEILAEDTLATTSEEFGAYFAAIPRSRIALEVGTHSPWVSALLEGLGHEVHVANPRKMESIKKSKRKNDKEDARKLARLVRSDPEFLYPIRQSGVEAS